jgi:hypothetical protein
MNVQRIRAVAGDIFWFAGAALIGLAVIKAFGARLPVDVRAEAWQMCLVGYAALHVR